MKGGYSRQRSVLYVSFTILLCKKELVSIIQVTFRLYDFKNCCQFINILSVSQMVETVRLQGKTAGEEISSLVKKSLKAFHFFPCSHSRSLLGSTVLQHHKCHSAEGVDTYHKIIIPVPQVSKGKHRGSIFTVSLYLRNSSRIRVLLTQLKTSYDKRQQKADINRKRLLIVIIQ